MYTFPKGFIENGHLNFNSEEAFDEAIKHGVFYLKIPEYVDLEPGWKYCSNFYKEEKNDGYTGFKNYDFTDSIFGYTIKPDQIEQIQLEKDLWKKYFPEDLVVLLKVMDEISIQLIHDIFTYVGVPESDWGKITGGIPENTALQYAIFNHFRSNINKIGGNEHKDSGFITLLAMVEKGQEIFINGEWYSVPPEDGYFCVNIGHSFEVLTSNLEKKVNATFHKVVQTTKAPGEEDRHTFGTYIGPKFEWDLYHYYNNKLEVFMPFIEFQKIKAREMKYQFHPKVKL